MPMVIALALAIPIACFSGKNTALGLTACMALRAIRPKASLHGISGQCKGLLDVARGVNLSFGGKYRVL